MDFSDLGAKPVSDKIRPIDFSGLGAKPVANITAEVPATGGRGFTDWLEENGGEIAGGIAGGIAGAAASVPTSGGLAIVPEAIEGAALGGAAGKALTRDIQYTTGRRSPLRDSAGGNALDIILSGITQGAGELGGQLVGLGFKGLVSKFGADAAKIGGQALQVETAVPAKYGEAVLKKPSILKDAPSTQEVSTMYRNFEKANGLLGLESHLIENEDRFTTSNENLEQMVVKTAKRVFKQNALKQAQEDAAKAVVSGNSELITEAQARAARLADDLGKPVEKQELYLASQAASKLKQNARIGTPQPQLVDAAAAVGQSKKIIDDELEKMIPGYQGLRQAKFESKARQAFSTLLPQNKNMTPNVLRAKIAGTAALASAGYGAAQALEGHPDKAAIGAGGAMLALGAESPAVAARMIRMGVASVPAAANTGRAALGAASAGLSDRARKILGYSPEENP